MATTADAKNALNPARQKQEMVVNTFKAMNLMLKEVLPKIITPERMARVCLTNFRLNPKLFECSKESIVGAVLQSAQLGLEPLLGRAYLIPYGNECQFQLGYKGMIELFYRNPEAKSLEARVVYENDYFKYEFGTESFLKHIPTDKDRGKVKGYYAVAKLKTGAYGFEYMTIQEAEAHAKKYSQAYRKGYTSPYQTEPDQMFLKTVIKKALKYMPMTVELQKALDADETIKEYTPDTEDMFEVIPKVANFAEEDEPKVGEGGEIIEPKVDDKKGKKVTKKEEVIEPAEVIPQTEQEKEAEEVGKLI